MISLILMMMKMKASVQFPNFVWFGRVLTEFELIVVIAICRTFNVVIIMMIIITMMSLSDQCYLFVLLQPPFIHIRVVTRWSDQISKEGKTDIKSSSPSSWFPGANCQQSPAAASNSQVGFITLVLLFLLFLFLLLLVIITIIPIPTRFMFHYHPPQGPHSYIDTIISDVDVIN